MSQRSCLSCLNTKSSVQEESLCFTKFFQSTVPWSTKKYKKIKNTYDYQPGTCGTHNSPLPKNQMLEWIVIRSSNFAKTTVAKLTALHKSVRVITGRLETATCLEDIPVWKCIRADSALRKLGKTSEGSHWPLVSSKFTSLAVAGYPWKTHGGALSISKVYFLSN